MGKVDVVLLLLLFQGRFQLGKEQKTQSEQAF